MIFLYVFILYYFNKFLKKKQQLLNINKKIKYKSLIIRNARHLWDLMQQLVLRDNNQKQYQWQQILLRLKIWNTKKF